MCCWHKWNKVKLLFSEKYYFVIIQLLKIFKNIYLKVTIFINKKALGAQQKRKEKYSMGFGHKETGPNWSSSVKSYRPHCLSMWEIHHFLLKTMTVSP